MYTGKSDAIALALPCVCTEGPAPGIISKVKWKNYNSYFQGKAFYQEHCTLMSQNGYPVGLKDFIKYCGCDPSKYNR